MMTGRASGHKKICTNYHSSSFIAIPSVADKHHGLMIKMICGERERESQAGTG